MILLWLLFSGFFEFKTYSTRVLGSGDVNEVLKPDASSIFTNPAFAGRVENWIFSFDTEYFFNESALYSYTFSTIFPYGYNTTGFGINVKGIRDVVSEITTAILLERNIYHNLYAAFTLKPLFLDTFLKDFFIFSYDAEVLYTKGNYIFDFAIFNFNSPEYSFFRVDTVKRIYKFAASYNSNYFSAGINYVDGRLKYGVNIPAGNIEFRMGYLNEALTFGAGINFGKIEFDISTMQVPLLGSLFRAGVYIW